MKASSLFASLFIALATLLLGACSSTKTSRPQVGVVYAQPTVEPVTVLSRTSERLSSSRGSVGSTIGSYAGSYGGGIAGSLVGGMLGSGMEKLVVKEKVSRYTLQKSDGTIVTLLQEKDRSPLAVGTSAYLVKNPTEGTTRVTAVAPQS